MTKGSKPTKGQRFEALEKTVSNVETSVRIMQMMQQQIGNQVMPMQPDLQGYASQLQTIQYTLLAMQELLGVDKTKLDTIFESRRLSDYDEASNQEDVNAGYTVKDKVESEEDIVIITSTTPDADADVGIFRSKVMLQEMGPDLTELLVGKSIGDKVEHEFQGNKHVIELLGVRQVPVTTEQAPAES